MARVIKKEFTEKPPVFATKLGRISAAERKERQKLTDEYEARLQLFKAEAEFIFWSSYFDVNPKYIFNFATVQTKPLKNFFTLFHNNFTHFEILLNKDGLQATAIDYKSLRQGGSSLFSHGNLVDNLSLQIKAEKVERFDFNIPVVNISFFISSKNLSLFLERITSNDCLTSIWIERSDYDFDTQFAKYIHFGVDDTYKENDEVPTYYKIIIPHSKYPEVEEEENVIEADEDLLEKEKNEIIGNEEVEVSFVDIGERKPKAKKKSKIIVLDK